jgi:hypothetical protein
MIEFKQQKVLVTPDDESYKGVQDKIDKILKTLLQVQTRYAFGDDLRIFLFGGYWKNDWFV